MTLHLLTLEWDLPEKPESFLDPDEIERMGRFVFEPDARRWSVFRVKAKRALAGHTDGRILPWLEGPGGKPWVDHPGLEFNLSHSETLAALVVSEPAPLDIDLQPLNPSTHQPINPSTHQPINPSTHQLINPSTPQPVGVDLEPLERAPTLLGCEDSFCHPAERAELPEEPGSRAMALLRLWTAKEALLKAVGTGLQFPPTEMIIRNGRGIGGPERCDEFHLLEPVDPATIAHRLAVAVPRRVETVTLA